MPPLQPLTGSRPRLGLADAGTGQLALLEWPAIRPETADSLHWGSKAFGLAGVVRGIVDAAGPPVDGSLRVRAKRAGHVDAATLVDSGGSDGFGRLVLFAPAFEGGERVELIGAG